MLRQTLSATSGDRPSSSASLRRLAITWATRSLAWTATLSPLGLSVLPFPQVFDVGPVVEATVYQILSISIRISLNASINTQPFIE